MFVSLELQMKLGKHEKQFKVESWIRGHHIRLVDTRALLTDAQNEGRGCELSLQAYRVGKMLRSLMLQLTQCCQPFNMGDTSFLPGLIHLLITEASSLRS